MIKIGKCKKCIFVFLAVVMLAALLPFTEPPAAFAAWNGSTPSSQPSTFTVSGNNYYINDEQALAWFAKTVTGGTTYSGKTIYLNADLNMNSATFDGIGTADKSFSGTFQGQGHTISNLKIYRSGSSRAALFNSVSGAVTINNLKLSNVNVSTSSSGGGWHATLVAKVESGSSTTTVTNITVTTATITSSDQTGGIVAYGQAPLSISNCTVTGLNLTGTDVNAGGIVGISDKVCTISNCTVSGTIKGTNRVGGILGKAEASGNKISGCTVSGTITASGIHVGGMCGNFNNDGNFEFRNCTNNATIQAKQEVGGILGYSKGHSNFYYCTNNGAITGTTDTGDRGVGCAAGILANNEDDELIFSYCTNTASINGKRCSGGICGDTGDGDTANFDHCYNWGAVTDTVARAAGITANSDTSGSEKYYYCINFADINSKSRTAGIVVGEETALDIYRCANFGNIYGSGDYDCGGICDSNTGTTNECFNMGAVHKASNSSYSIGGISGALGTVTNCYNGGNIYTANHVAGIAAYNVKVSNCYNYGNITNGKHGNYQIRCDNGGSVTNCYYLNTASGTAQSGATSKTSAQLKELSSSLSTSFVKDTWGINNGYPILKWWRDEYFKFPVQLIDGSTTVLNTTYAYNAAFTAPARSKTGYTFNGWYTAASGGTKAWGPAATTVTAGVTSPTSTCGMTWSTGANRPNVLPTTNPLKYYAQYSANQYAVTLNNNTGSGGTGSVTATYDSAMPSATMPTKTGYTFQGYYDTNAASGGTQYYTSAGASARTWNKASTATLYARWTANTNTAYKVNHYQMKTDGSTYTLAETETLTGTSDATLTISSYVKTYSGFTYDHATVGGNTVTDTTVAPDGSRVINMYYTRNQVNVTFNPNGTGYTYTSPAAKAYYDGSVSFTVTLSEGYTNSGNPAVTATCGSVNANKNGNTITYTVNNITSATTITVGPAAINTYTVTFKSEGGTVLKTETVNYGGSATPPAAQTKDPDATYHYTFNGWSGYTNVTENKTITASFTPTAHTPGAWQTDNAQHWKVCTACGYYTTAKADHTYGAWSADTATCLAGGSHSRTCSACGKTQTETTPSLGHDLIHHEAKAATCTEAGWEAYDTCSRCDYTTKVEIPALNHNWGDWGGNTATCLEGGTETRECGRCHVTESRDTVALGHDLINHEAKAATCTEAGWEAYDTCSRCDYTTKVEIPALNHSWGDWGGNTATCLEGGTETRECGRCHETESRETEPLGHDLINHEAKEATCTEAGWEAYDTCSRCDYTTKVEIPALNHSWGDWGGNTATCLEGGTETRECGRCHETESRETEPLGHDLIHHEAKAATCTEAGWEAYDTCSRCDYTTKVEIPALNHSWGDWGGNTATCLEGGTETRECGRCHVTESRDTVALGHDLINHVAKAATCTEAGWEAYDTCSRCDYTTKVEIPALNHSWGDWGGNTATCLEGGTETRECGRCHVTESRDTVALGHDLINHEAKEATCTEAGWEAYDTCSRCDYTTKVEIPALNHSWGDWGGNTATCLEGGTETRECGRCHVTESRDTVALGHDLINHEAKAATCTEAGWEAYDTCSRCDYTTKVEIPALNHSWGDWGGNTATCLAGGTETRECSRCHVTESRETEPLGHDLGEWTVTDEPTCTEAGAKKRECSRCEYYETDTVVALGHDLINHEAKEATCTEAGWEAYDTCSRCDYTTKVEIPALNHNWGDWGGNTATCLEGGTETRECGRCHVTESRDTVALGHDLIHHEAKEATCTEAGWEAYDTCSRCDYTTKVEIPALNHSWGDWGGNTATCLEGGTETRECSRCHVTEDRDTAALGHDPVAHAAKAPTCTAIGWDAYETCSRCDYTTYVEKAALGHDPIAHEAKAPTCTAIGWDAYETCSRCDYTTYVEKAALGHNYVPVVTEPTCTAGGYTTYTCSRCGDTYTADETAALGHSAGEIVRENEVPATCVSEGSYEAVVSCVRCGEELSRSTVTVPADPDAHVWGDWTATVTPTCTTDGVEIRYCACDASHFENRIVYASGHTWGEWVTVTAASPEGNGLERRTCLVCGEPEEREIQWNGEMKRVIQFVVSGSMHYVVHMTNVNYEIYSKQTPAIYWYEGADLTFEVVLNADCAYSQYIVTLNDKELKPNADGSYTIPGGTDYAKINVNPVSAAAEEGGTVVTGSVCKYCGNVHPNNFWGMLVAFFHSMFYFFKHLFG